MRLSLPPVARGATLAVSFGVAACAWSTRANAQELRGIVRDSATRQAIPTVVLLVVDSAGSVLARNLTNERGQFRMPLPGAARRLHLLRIGFRPREMALPAPNDGLVTLDVSMRVIPTLLEPVHVVDSPNCPRRADRTAAFALWEQARAALLASVVARETDSAVIKRLHFDRQLGEDGFTAVTQGVHVDSTAGVRPFVASHPASEFIERGFVDDSAHIAVFNGPDAEVMLDDAFPRGYCFQLADADRARPHQVGIAFEAASHRHGRVDVEGAVWIDSTTRSLEEIVFRYVGLDQRFDRYEPGGRVSFRTMSDGTPIIDRWVIRPIGVPATSRIVSFSANDMHESGGEVARARWEDGRTWVASLGTLTGVVTHGRIPSGGQIVTLAGTDYVTVSDSDGRFTIPDLVPGPYTIAIADSLLAPLDIVLKTKVSFTAVRDSTTSVAFEAATAEDYAAQMCSRKAPAAGRSIIVGRVVLPDDSPALGAEIEPWIVTETGLVSTGKERVDSHGLFHVCSIPTGSKIELRAQRDSRTVTWAATQTYDVLSKIEPIRLTLRPFPRPN